MKRPDDACDARDLIAACALGDRSAATALELFDRGLTWRAVLDELSGNAAPVTASTLAAEQLAMAETSGAIQ